MHAKCWEPTALCCPWAACCCAAAKSTLSGARRRPPAQHGLSQTSSSAAPLRSVVLSGNFSFMCVPSTQPRMCTNSTSAPCRQEHQQCVSSGISPKQVPHCCTYLQVGHLLSLSGFPRGLTAVLRGHRNRELAVEAAWLLAFITAGPEAHMHAMIKHGAAEAVSTALLSKASSCHQQGQASAPFPAALYEKSSQTATGCRGIMAIGDHKSRTVDAHACQA